jgi:ABC-2 type transport system ATP-binding protein
MSIVIERLERDYGELRALKGVDLRIEHGGITGLLGPNGAGKTTLVETLEGLREPSRGRVSVLGLDPVREAPRLRLRMGAQLQSTSIPPDLTPAEVLGMYAAFYPTTRPVTDVLDRVGLAAKSKALVRNLSGGQRQRLALAMAILHGPELLILDEPTTGLDPVARRALHELVRALRADGCSIILTTHYIEEAEQLCDRVIVLRAGEVVADGTPFELLQRSGGSSTLWIACSGPFDPTPLLAAGASAQGREGVHHRFVTREPAAAVVALGDMLRLQGLTLTDLRMKRPTLEDVYLELVGPDPDAAPVETAS